MNCEKCQELLSDFLDDALSPEDKRTLGVHLEECLSCFAVRDELNSIISFCCGNRGEYVAPPNERALWLRIRNTVESERAAVAVASVGVSEQTERSENWWSRLMHRSWELSLSQIRPSRDHRRSLSSQLQQATHTAGPTTTGTQ